MEEDYSYEEGVLFEPKVNDNTYHWVGISMISFAIGLGIGFFMKAFKK